MTAGFGEFVREMKIRDKLEGECIAGSKTSKNKKDAIVLVGENEARITTGKTSLHLRKSRKKHADTIPSGNSSRLEGVLAKTPEPKPLLERSHRRKAAVKNYLRQTC